MNIIGRIPAKPGVRSKQLEEDKKTKTVNKIYDPEQTGKAGSERVEGLKSERVEEETKKQKIFRISLWIGVLTVVLILILWVLHNWLAYWVVTVYTKYDFADTPCWWIIRTMPLSLVGEELLNSDSYHNIRSRKNALDFLFPYLNSSNEQYRRRAWEMFAIMISIRPQDIPREKLFYYIIEGIQHEDDFTRNEAGYALVYYIAGGIYGIKLEEYVCECLINSLEQENNSVVKDNLLEFIDMVDGNDIEPFGDTEEETKHIEDEEVKQNVQIFIEVLREYHKNEQ